MLPESPIFYYSKHDYDSARKQLAIIAKWNKKAPFTDKFDSELMPGISPAKIARISKMARESRSINDNSSESLDTKEENIMLLDIETCPEEGIKLEGTLKELVAFKPLVINLVLMSFFWASVSFSFYMLGFFIKHLKGDIFVNSYMGGLGEMLAVPIQGIVYYKKGPKFTLSLAFGIAFLGSVLMLSLSDSIDGMPFFVMITRIGTNIGFGTCFLANA